MPRNVRIATVSLQSNFKETVRDQALQWIEQAGRAKADIVCVPEYACGDCNNGNWPPAPIPGAITQQFAKLAKQFKMWVIAPMVESRGPKEKFHYNTAVLFDRRGRIAGKYRKSHICMPGHGEGQIMLAGDDIPVFTTDFARIGITICMDIHYPELYMSMALKGAEVIFWPSGALDYTGDLMESITNTRAIDNQVYFVCSHYVDLPFLVGKPTGRSRVIDCMGRIRADTGHFPGVAIADVDLDEVYPMWYSGAMLQTYPTMRDTFFKSRRPELYGELTKPVTKLHYERALKVSPRRHGGTKKR